MKFLSYNGTIYLWNKIKEKLKNVESATKATQDGNGNIITNTYGTSLSVEGKKVTLKNKNNVVLSTITTQDTVYTHPSTHTASMITPDSTHRFVTDMEKSTWADKYTKAEVDNKFSQLETAIDWKESVATYANIATTYPNPQDGWTVNVKDTDYTYRYNGSAWVAISANSIPLATSSVDGKMSKTDKTKLDGVSAGANNYTHPSTHPANIITTDATHRFVTDTEKNSWNGKASTTVATTTSNGLMTAYDKNKLNGVSVNANNYVHPTTHAASMITTDATHRFVTDTEKNTWNDKLNAISNIKSLASQTKSVASGVITSIDSYTFTASGVYIVFAKIAAHALPTSAYKLSYILYNGNQYISEDSVESAGLYRAALGGVVVAEKGKKVELTFEHNSGSNYNATGGLQIVRIK